MRTVRRRKLRRLHSGSLCDNRPPRCELHKTIADTTTLSQHLLVSGILNNNIHKV